ncbi:hypothetical protein HDR60_02895 [bacterium]|nr:hypothetical protein [bacterium]
MIINNVYEKYCEENERLSDKQRRNKRYKKKITYKKIYKLNAQILKAKYFDDILKNKSILVKIFETALKNRGERR